MTFKLIEEGTNKQLPFDISFGPTNVPQKGDELLFINGRFEIKHRCIIFDEAERVSKILLYVSPL